MTRIALVAVVLTVASVGCGSKSLSTSETGGAPGTGGWVGAGGVPYIVATGGTGGGDVPTPRGAGGFGGDAAFCGVQLGPFFPWQISVPSSSGGAGGGGDAGFSGCQRLAGTDAGAADDADLSCGGQAWLRATGGPGGAVGPTITWDDGSQLAWVGPTSFPPPITAGAPDERVWVELVRQNPVLKMELRDSSGAGAIRLMAWNGVPLADPTAEQIIALFGVDASSTATCSWPILSSGTETVYDHLLQTTPPQRIPYGQVTEVNAPTGSFVVLWDSAYLNTPASEDCLTCIGGWSLGFVASKQASPQL
jgi:hypothetical protein